MENSLINKAHQEQRKADVLLKQKKFDECLTCHRNAIEYLSQAMKTNQQPIICLESLQLQIGQLERQIKIVTMKKVQYENMKNTELHKTEKPNYEMESDNSNSSLQGIYATMEQHDSFISYLTKRESGSDNDSCSVSDSDEKLEKSLHGFKHPKDDAIIIEEFKELCNSYRDSIKVLLCQLDERNKEITELKVRVKHLEQDKFKGQTTKDNNSLKVITDSSGGTSPYVFSPSSELSPDVRDTELLQLAPLEMPTFDFSNFTTCVNPNNNN